MTFYIYNQTALLNSTTKNITGSYNSSIFSYNLTNETTYTYNCIATNNQSKYSQTENHTITYDITSPQIELISPVDDSRITSPVTFEYNETEANKDFCNLSIDGSVNVTGINMTSGSWTNYTVTLPYGPHNWSITCWDDLNNWNTSHTWNFTVQAPDLFIDNNRVLYRIIMTHLRQLHFEGAKNLPLAFRKKENV